MNSNLVLNPCLRIFKNPNALETYLLEVPVPGQGIRHLNIPRSEFPGIYGTIQKFLEIGLNFLDTESDLDDEAKRIFEAEGVLIEKASVPVLPLFSCQLDDVPPADIPDGTTLIVNESFSFDPLDLAKTSEWMYQRHLLPTQATAWLKNPVTGIETGYWLTPTQAARVEKLKGGQVLNGSEKEDEIIRRLYAVGLVNTEERFEEETRVWDRKIQKAYAEFKESGYTVLERLLPDLQITALRTFYAEYVKQGFMHLGDGYVEKRFWQHNEPFARSLNLSLVNLMNAVTGEKVKPSYCFAASYVEGAELRPHVDREQCEFSVSFQVDFRPETADGVSPWALGVFTPSRDLGAREQFEWQEISGSGVPSGESTDIYLRNGDGLFYKGRELIHYRHELDAGCTSTSIFLHYVREDFEGGLI